MVSPRLLIAAVILLMPLSSFAYMTVKPGSYITSAFVVRSDKGPLALFNFRTLSEVRITLAGSIARDLMKQNLGPYRLEFVVPEPILNGSGKAQLVHFTRISEEQVPSQVGSNLKSVKKKKKRRHVSR